MATLVIGKRKNAITVFFFQLCVITNNMFSYDEKMFIVSKVATLLFFGIMALRILFKGKVHYNQILLLPILFTVYCAATILWAYSPNTALGQMVTQVQLLLLLLFTFWAMNDGVTVLDYLKAVYLSGFGMIIFMVIREGGPVQYLNAMLDGQRMGGSYANPYGMVFGNAALSASYYTILKGKKKHILCVLLFSFFALSTASRKAMLMVAMGVMIMALIHYGLRRIYWTLLAVIAVCIAAYFVLKLPYFNQIGQRLINLLSGEQDMSDIERSRMANVGIEMFKEKPILGYGIGNYAVLSFWETYSHHNYVELLVSGGIVALIMYYLMLLIPGISLLQSKKKSGSKKMEHLHLMLLIWLVVELIFGVAMVQLYNKNSWLLMGVLMAETVHVSHRKVDGREGANETVE